MPQNNHSDSSFPFVVSGLIAHLYFNRIEPRHPIVWLLLLIATPVVLSIGVNASAQSTNFQSTVKTTLFSALIHNISLILSTILYRLSPVHPLAKYPGPILARISTLYLTWLAAGGKRYIAIGQLHAKYGPHIRIGPNYLSVIDVGAVKDCMGSQGMPRSTTLLWSKIAPFNLISCKSMVNPNHDEDHARRRKAWNQAFTGQALKDYDSYLSHRTELLIRRMGDQSGPVDLGKWIGYFTFDFMGDIIFGGGFEMLRDGGDYNNFWPILAKSVNLISIVSSNDYMGHLVPYLPADNAAQRMISFAKEQTLIRKERGPTTKDLYYFLAEDGSDSQLKLTDKQLTDEMFLGILGGADTTSSVLANAFYEILTNPSILSNLRDELDKEFGNEEPVDSTRLAGLHYLNAVINESLRLYPAVPFNISRTPEPGSGGKLVGGKFVPEGTTVFIPVYNLHRNPDYFFPNPEKFWPERWISAPSAATKEKSNVVLNRDAFSPFSYGPANCVGKHLAYKEMRALIARVVKSFDMEFEAGYNADEYIKELREEYVFVKGRLPVLLKKRV